MSYPFKKLVNYIFLLNYEKTLNSQGLKHPKIKQKLLSKDVFQHQERNLPPHLSDFQRGIMTLSPWGKFITVITITNYDLWLICAKMPRRRKSTLSWRFYIMHILRRMKMFCENSELVQCLKGQKSYLLSTSHSNISLVFIKIL